MTDSLKQTALTERHRAAGAKMAPFAGWEMPLEFDGTVAEHTAVRERVGIFDVSHLGTVFVAGGDDTATVARAFTCDAAGVAPHSSQYTLCCTPDGGILDDLIVYRLDDRWMVIPNAANTDAVVERLREVAGDGVTVDDRSSDHAVLAIQGPDGLALASEVLGHDVRAIDYLGLAVLETAHGRAIVTRTGYTGEPGCEIVIDGAGAVGVWEAAVEAGAAPAGLGARDTLRLEMGYPLHGNDLDVTTNPFQARLGWAVKLDHEFVGRDALAAIKERGADTRLLGLRGEGRRPLRAGLAVLVDGERVGALTSGGFSPTLQAGIGLGYLPADVEPGTAAAVDVRGREVAVQVVRPPFVPRSPKAD